MALIVQKFGGTSLTTVDLIKKAALRVKDEVEAGYQVVVVLSAMGGMTDQLVGQIRQLSSGYDRAEYDTVVSAGEQVSVGLLAMALKNMGLQARSWLGWQLPILTNEIHSSAKIADIPTESIKASLERGTIAVVAGFQGLSPQGRITTLGRGGSDTTAVALAATLEAERCDIYTDVEGVYTADPRYVSKAGKLDKIAYTEMLELSSQGAKVLQRESVELAMKHRVPLRVMSSSTSHPGTLISEEGQDLDQQIRGVVQSLAHHRVTLKNVPRSFLSHIKDTIQAEGIYLEMPRQTLSPCGGEFDFSFTVPEEGIDHAEGMLKDLKNTLKYSFIKIDSNIAKISIVGPSLSENPNLVQKLFHTLSEQGIQIEDVSTSDIKISVLVGREEMEKALSVLHTAYNLDIKETLTNEFGSEKVECFVAAGL